MSTYIIGEDIRFTLSTIDVNGNDITLDHVDIGAKRIGDTVNAFDYDETDTGEVTVALGLVTVVVPASVTAALLAGTYCVEWTAEDASGNIDKLCGSFVLRGCCG
jgi:hypothetical protein